MMNGKTIATILFHHTFKAYLFTSFLGVLGGLLVAFFSQFPHDDLWGLALFSSMTFGFWMCTCALMALFSSKNYVAGLHVALYVYFMFYITGIFKRLAVVRLGYNTMSYFYNGFWQELAYGIPAAVGCFGLAFVLWYGRKSKPLSVVLRFLPLVFIFTEAAVLIIKVFTVRQGLLMSIIDTACALVYAWILLRYAKETGT